MQKTRLGLAILTSFLVIIFLMQPMAESVYAQSTKPSAPEFTAQAPNESTIELVIKNQAFTSSESVNAIEYYYRVKDHYSELWIRNGGDGQLQSDSKTTLVTIKTPYPSDYPFDPALERFVNSSLIDFQVQAKTGYYLQRYVQGQMPGTPIKTDGYWETTFNISETSDWSSTQTVNLSEPATSPHPTATMQPTAAPTASPTTTRTPTSTTIEASTDSGTNVVLAINGNITSTQMSNVTIATNQSETTTTISFTLTGQSGAIGLGNLTIPKSAVQYGTTPSIYIDGQQAENQGYTQDANNYYVWYTTHFSTHKVSIVFTQSSPIPEFPWLVVLPLFVSMLFIALKVKTKSRTSVS